MFSWMIMIEFFSTCVTGIIITLYESVIDKSIWKGFRLLSEFNSLYKLINEKGSHYKQWSKLIKPALALLPR